MQNLSEHWQMVVIVVSILAWGIQIGLQWGQFKALRTDVGRLARKLDEEGKTTSELEIARAAAEQRCLGHEQWFDDIKGRVEKLEGERRTA